MYHEPVAEVDKDAVNAARAKNKPTLKGQSPGLGRLGRHGRLSACSTACGVQSGSCSRCTRVSSSHPSIDGFEIAPLSLYLFTAVRSRVCYDDESVFPHSE